jgi:hypothetical protein
LIPERGIDGAIETVVGRSHYELIPTIPDRWRQVHQQGLEGFMQRCDEDSFILSDGSRQWLKWEVQPWETTLVSRKASGKANSHKLLKRVNLLLLRVAGRWYEMKRDSPNRS